MSDIISAKCFGCGHVVKVPSALGGKKARCPKCTNTITIPAPTETAEDVISDDELPEVAKDDEVLDGLPVEEPPPPEPAAPSRETRTRPGSSSAHRRIPAGGRGAAPRYGAPRKKSSAGLIIGLAIGAFALVVIIAVAASSGGKPLPPKTPEDEQGQTGQPPVREKTAADLALEDRVKDYISEFNRGNIAKAAQFYGDRAGEMRQTIGQMVDKGTQYRNFNFKSTNADTGVVTISCEYVTKTETVPYKEITWTWRNADGSWVIAGAP